MTNPTHLPLFDSTGAELSEDRVYRYTLHRIWNPLKRPAVFIGLNPSTADETEDDPTITRCINYAKAWGCGGLFMLNIFAYRATDPKTMKDTSRPVGPRNDYWLLRVTEANGIIIAAWGNHGKYLERDLAVRELLFHKDIYCLGTTKTNQPKHPLYLRANLKPVLYWEGKTP